MGVCSSCESRRESMATAKLILPDGRLEEYPYPVKASRVLQKLPAVFICNSDEMEFHDVAYAVSEEELLEPGQLYFALPLSRLHHPLLPEEMAALAVKASSALINSTDRQLLTRQNQSPRRGRVGNKGHKFTAMLTAIPE